MENEIETIFNNNLKCSQASKQWQLIYRGTWGTTYIYIYKISFSTNVNLHKFFHCSIHLNYIEIPLLHDQQLKKEIRFKMFHSFDCRSRCSFKQVIIAPSGHK